MTERLRLDDGRIHERLAALPGWAVEERALVRTFSFPSFADAIVFITRVAFDAEAADHHPDLTLNYRKVRVSWSTHSEGGITALDFDGAAAAERTAARLGAK